MVARAIEALSSSTARLAAWAGLAMTLLIFVDVVARYVFVKPILFADEISVYLFIFITFIGAAGAMKEGRFIRADILLTRLGTRKRLYLDLATWLVSIVIIGVVLWQSVIMVHKAYTTGFTAMSVLLTPMWIPQSILPVGLLLLGMQSVLETCKVVVALRTGGTGGQGAPPGGV